VNIAHPTTTSESWRQTRSRLKAGEAMQLHGHDATKAPLDERRHLPPARPAGTSDSDFRVASSLVAVLIGFAVGCAVAYLPARVDTDHDRVPAVSRRSTTGYWL
jgi:hypothetical protein